MNCIFRLAAVSWTMFDGWSPPWLMAADMSVMTAACESRVWPQARDMASYQLPRSPADAPRMPLPPAAAAPAMNWPRPTFPAAMLVMVLSFSCPAMARLVVRGPLPAAVLHPQRRRVAAYVREILRQPLLRPGGRRRFRPEALQAAVGQQRVRGTVGDRHQGADARQFGAHVVAVARARNQVRVVAAHDRRHPDTHGL